MIYFGGYCVEDTKFPDGTFLPQLDNYHLQYLKDCSSAGLPAVLTWLYENDAELFVVYSFARFIQSLGYKVRLKVPYLPNARMDRVKLPTDVFTLKYFAEIINMIGFKSVETYDVHSSASGYLIDNLKDVSPAQRINFILNTNNFNPDTDVVVFPDLGCVKRLGDDINFPYVIGNKKRDWKTGKLQGTEIFGTLPKEGFRVLFVDDICAYGGTAMYTIKALKELGAGDCMCYFSHIEKSIFGKEGYEETNDGRPTLLESGLVSKIFCSDSLQTFDNMKKYGEKFNVKFEIVQGFR